MRTLVLLFFLLNYSFAIDLNYFNATYDRALKKDQNLIIDVFDRGEQRAFSFRWTLFHNEGLVTLSNYNGHPSQHVLYTKYQRDTIKIKLALRKEETSRYHPYLLITFLGYDYVTKSARFTIYHKDVGAQTQIVLKD